ncbi:MAG: succinate dehydrogenase cytochrome b subunit [Myxococcales bacterium]|nr:succinate dehydrogenase cytochrome b subunit [Myxococcales bacterium]MCB9533035.1 succinate dehydrogenase cytochrome b subunit [Myxococcales bacterium]
MDWLFKVVGSSIGRKFAAGLTGLGLVGFLCAHLLGNLNLYGGPAALDHYAEGLHALPGFPLAELGLVAMLIAHVVLVIGLTRENRAARGGSRYAVNASKRPDAGPSSIASRVMAVTGLLTLGFLVAHIAHFRLRRAEFHAPDGVHGLGDAVIATITNPLWMPVYVVGSLLVAFHMLHGIQSAARSLGLNHRKWTPIVEKVGLVLAIVLGLGFATLPIAAKLGLFCDGSESCATAHDAPPTAP